VNTVANLDADERTFDPEYNWTTELALRFASDGPVQEAQATVYRVDWRNAQIMGLPTTPGVNSLIITNTAGITSRGMEAKLRLRAGRLLTGTLAWSLVDARFTRGSDDPGSRVFCGLAAQPPTSDFCDHGPPRSTTGGNIALVPYLDGNHAARAPRVSWHVGLQLQPVAVASGWSAAAETALSGQGDVFERPINGARYGARRLLGGRITLFKGDMAFALWGSNLTDERYVRTAASRGGNFYPSMPRPTDLLYGERRRVGLSVRLDVLTP
jgi:outer membrane receptor protein involved in Fe transport